jgi:hypothetical protein
MPVHRIENQPFSAKFDSSELRMFGPQEQTCGSVPNGHFSVAAGPPSPSGNFRKSKFT